MPPTDRGNRMVTAVPRPSSLSNSTVAVLQVDKALHQRQADSGALHAASVRAVRPKEPLPQPLQVRLGDADAGVANHDAAEGRIAVCRDSDRARHGVLHRVGQQIEQDRSPTCPDRRRPAPGGSRAPTRDRPAGTVRRTTTRCARSARRHRCTSNWRWHGRLRSGRSPAANRPAVAGVPRYAARQSADSSIALSGTLSDSASSSGPSKSVSGVRNSWLTLVRNAVLARSSSASASARCRCCS